VSACEGPSESGEHRLLRMRDRRRLAVQRGIAAVVLGGGAVAFLLAGGLDMGWDLVWVVPLFLLMVAVWYAVESAGEALLERLLRPIFGPLSSRGYSYYDDEDEPAPDYSMAEVITDEEDPQPLPEEEEAR
jgi:hypothetical protein